MHFRFATALPLAAALIVGCSAPPSALKPAPVPELAAPALPGWIASVSPAGSAQSLAQIRVVFKQPVASLQALENDGPRELLDRFSIEPVLRGHFVLLTPRMVGFVGEQALPIGMRARVTLHAGLRDLAGDTLAQDLAWTFATAPLEFRDLPQVTAPNDESTPPPLGVRPTLTVVANAPPDLDSLASHAWLVAGAQRIALTVRPQATPTPMPGAGAAEAFDPSLNEWRYDLAPRSDLARATTYALRIEPGVEPAYGNVPTANGFSGAIRTYGPLTLRLAPPSNDGGGRFAGGDPAIAFSNPIDAASLPGAVTVSPAPAKVDPLTQRSDDGMSLAIDPYALDPNRRYSVTIAGSVRDTFGQRLGQSQTVTVTTGDFAPGAWAPTGSNTIAAGANVALNFYATNLPGNRYQVAYAALPPTKLLGYTDPLAVLPPVGRWPASVLADARRNQQSRVRVPLEERLGGSFGALAYGFRTALDPADSSPGLTGIAQLTDLGAFATFFPTGASVFAQRVHDGSPAPGVSVSVYRNVGSSSGTPAICATGSTDASGEARFAGIDLDRCYAGSSADQAPTLGIVARQGRDAATLTLYGSGGLYRFSVSPGWIGGAPLSRGTVFSDRQMYQPGETARMTGVAYYVASDRIVADRRARYKLTLTDPNNAATRLADVTTDDYGIFSLPVVLRAHQPLGYYTIEAKGPAGNTIDGSFRVAEFKPPNFALDLQLSAPWAQAGGSVRASATGKYLFGAPLQGGTAHAYVTREAATVAPKGWDDFWFGRQWFWPESTPSFETDVLQRDLALDADGKTTLDVPVPADLPFPMTYTVDLNATDVSNLSVANSQSFLALGSDATIGLKSDAVGNAGTPIPIHAIVTDAAGKPVAGRTVHLELQKMTYTSATQELEGGQGAQEAVKYETVAQADVTSGQTPVDASLAPNSAGSFRVRATFAGAKSDASATDLQIFAFGAGQADFGNADQTVTPVELDRRTYAIGQTATALIASPFDRSDVYVSVVRGGTLYRTVLHEVAGSARVAFRVTPEMLPNAAVMAVVVRRGENLARLKPGALTTLSRTGAAAFHVDLSGKYLQLGISPERASVAPGASQTVGFRVRDRSGAPVAGEIVAMVVNDAILQLSGYRLPDLVATVFADQPISAIVGDSRDGMLLKTPGPPQEKGFGYGGGYLAGAAGTRVRRQFLPLAYYGTLHADASGHATATFKLPDDLTTWRVMAVAVGRDMRFATSDSTFVTSLPLMLNPLVPQFARPGDRFDLGASVSNQTGADGALDLVLGLSGALAFASGDAHAQTVQRQAATGMQAVRLAVAVGTPAPSTISAKGSLGSHADAFEVPFDVRDRAVTESVLESGVVTNGTATVPLHLSNGRVRIELANSIVGQTALPFGQALRDDPLPLASEAASRLTIATVAGDLAKRATNLRALLAFERSDGGFSEMQDATQSDPFVSAAALTALVPVAQAADAAAPGVMKRARAFVADTLANPGRFRWCEDATCKTQLRFEALWALAQAGDRRTDFLSDIAAASGSFDDASQIRLARFLLQTPGWEARGVAMADRLVQTVYLTGRYANANPARPWGPMGSNVQAQAQMLQLLIDRRAPVEQRDGAVRALLAQQCRCGWPTLEDTAAAALALQAYARFEPVGPAQAQALAGGRTIAQATLPATPSSQSSELDAAGVHGDRLEIRARGTVHYTVLYTYPVRADAPGQLAPLRVTRTIGTPASPATALATMDLAPPAPVTVHAGQVFDVGVRVIADHPIDRLVIDDPLPAGFEAVDTTFATALKAVVPRSDSWEIDAQQTYRDRVVAYAAHLGPGVYELHYLVRSVTTGEFAWPGTRAYLRDAPEQFGRSAATRLRIEP